MGEIIDSVQVEEATPLEPVAADVAVGSGSDNANAPQPTGNDAGSDEATEATRQVLLLLMIMPVMTGALATNSALRQTLTQRLDKLLALLHDKRRRSAATAATVNPFMTLLATPKVSETPQIVLKKSVPRPDVPGSLSFHALPAASKPEPVQDENWLRRLERSARAQWSSLMGR
jgi:hypothetical protein